MKARLALLATMCVVVVLNACGDPTSLKASAATSVDTLFVFALSGTPPSYPSGISLLVGQAVQVNGFAGFDVAFDIDADGNAIVYPIKLVIPSVSGSRAVGLLKLDTPFETVLEAPATGYEFDSAFVASPGETLVIRSQHNFSQDVCQFALNPYLYAKIAVDSVSLASRTIYLKLGLDPNCGFRSFATGVPTN
jgi:hypothetical protein